MFIAPDGKSIQMRRKDPTPRPYEILRELASIRPGLFKRLTDNYRLAYSLGYSARRGGGNPEIMRPGHSDPTGDTVAEQEGDRRRVAFAGRKIKEAVAALDGADRVLASITERGTDRARHGAGEVVDPEDIRAAQRHMRRELAPGGPGK